MRIPHLSLPLLVALLLPSAMLLHAQSPAPSVPKTDSLESRRKALNAVFTDYWEDKLKHQPEFASEIGDKRYNDQVTDHSAKAFNATLEREQDFLMRLSTIDPSGFTEQEKTSRELLLRHFTEDTEAAEFKEWEMPVSQKEGVHLDFPQLAAELSFTTVKDYDDWTARLRLIPHLFEQTTTNMSIGVEDGRVPPKLVLEEALAQVKKLAADKPEDSPLALPLKSFPASIPAAEQERIKTEMLAAITKQALPAYQRLAIYIEKSYIPAGRTEPGLSALPDGAKYYAFLLRRMTTTSLTAAQIHQIGLDEVKRDEAEMLALAQKLGFQDLATFRASLKTNPKLHPASRDAMLDAVRGYLTPMQAKLPQLFGRLPKAPFEVAAVPDYQEKTAAPAYYQQGTPDGSRPGRLFIDTYNATERNLYGLEVMTYHEGLPGHHLQISIAQELTDVPAFRKFDKYTAYTEGWGLYSERLGKEVGFYQDPYSDYGRLEADIWRAIRLVVDTGVHNQSWTRDQMVQYFRDHSAIDETSIQSEVDRYIAVPAQATAYKIGQLKILELRDHAKKALGDGFDLRDFHDQVLDAGALPLDVLEERIDNWIASRKVVVR
jgi:uncharacterized protein (DUF885 family)